MRALPLTEATSSDLELLHSARRHLVALPGMQECDILEQSPLAILVTDAAGLIRFANPRLCALTGYDPEELIGASWTLLRGDGDGDGADAAAGESLQGCLLRGESWQGDARMRRKSGETYIALQVISPLRGSDAKPCGYVSVSLDAPRALSGMTDLQRDALCDIADRSGLQRHIETLLAAAGDQTDARRFAVAFVDIDHFRLVNDRHGHGCGDRALRELARRLQDAVAGRGMAARLGGDEFALVLRGVDDEAGLALFLEELRASLCQPLLDGEESVSVSASMGVAFAPRHGHGVSELMRAADKALGVAKRGGRNRVCFYHPDLLEQGTLFDRGLLLSALDQRQFYPVFQPVVSCQGRPELGHYEALARWQHPELGLVSPARFLPSLQQFGLINALTDLMLEQVCAIIAAAPTPLVVALNVTASDLIIPGWGESFLAVLQRHGVSPAALRLEITESELIENYEACLYAINLLRMQGVSVYLDDFGVGYASLAHLRRLPVDGLKIDRSFLSDFPVDPRSVDIIRAIIDMAGRLGLEVIAEGVEEMSQARQLRALGCDALQGFLFGQPGRSFPGSATSA